jgi:hypothetical protein
MRTRLFQISTLALLLLTSLMRTTVAQEKLEDENRAFVYLSVDVAALKSLPGVGEDGLDLIVRSLGLDMMGPMFDHTKVERVVFAAHCDQFEDYTSYQWSGRLPFSFYILVTFSDASVLAELRDDERGMEFETIEGKKYLRAPESANVENWIAHVGQTKFVVGSEDYVLHGSEEFMTERLEETLKGIPTDSIVRGGIDGVAARNFIESFLEVAPLVQPMSMLEPLAKADTARIAAFNQEKLLSLTINSKDNETAKEIEGALAQVIGIGMDFAPFLKAQMPTEAGSKGLAEIFQQAKPEREGSVVKVEVKKGESFDLLMDDLEKLLEARTLAINRTNNLRQLALACHNYESAMQRFPFNTPEGGKENPELSWRARILPFLEEQNTWNQMDMTEAPGHEANAAFSEKMPAIYGPDKTNAKYAWFKTDVVGFEQIRDGSSNTIMLLELPEGRPWLETNDLKMLEAVRMIKGLEDGVTLAAARYDGSVTFLDNTLTHNQIKALFTPAGGEVIDFDLPSVRR